MIADTYKQIERDLLWVIKSPLLLKLGDQDPLRKLISKFPNVKDINIEDPTFSKRLGRYFEFLFERILDCVDGYKNIARGKQLKLGKESIGEIDFLGEFDGSCIHIETAVKLYLKKDDLFLGPNKTDRLDLKIKKLTDHQLKLPIPLGEFGLTDQKISRVAFVKGYLFYPWQEWLQNKFEYPDVVNEDHQKGWWITLGNAHHISEEQYRFVIPEKLLWLSKIISEDILDFENVQSTCQEYFDHKEFPQLAVFVVRMKFNDQIKMWVEVDRGFVTRDDY